MHKHKSVRPNHNHPHAHPQRISARQRPIVKLQSIIGNQAVQRLLVQREEETADERATRFIWQKLKQNDRLIRGRLNTIESSVMPDERETKLPTIQTMKTAYQATGILTVEMIDAVERVVQPVWTGGNYVSDALIELRQLVRENEEMREGLDNPDEWYTNYMNHRLKIINIR